MTTIMNDVRVLQAGERMDIPGRLYLQPSVSSGRVIRSGVWAERLALFSFVSSWRLCLQDFSTDEVLVACSTLISPGFLPSGERPHIPYSYKGWIRWLQLSCDNPGVSDEEQRYWRDLLQLADPEVAEYVANMSENWRALWGPASNPAPTALWTCYASSDPTDGEPLAYVIGPRALGWCRHEKPSPPSLASLVTFTVHRVIVTAAGEQYVGRMREDEVLDGQTFGSTKALLNADFS